MSVFLFSRTISSLFTTKSFRDSNCCRFVRANKIVLKRASPPRSKKQAVTSDNAAPCVRRCFSSSCMPLSSASATPKRSCGKRLAAARTACELRSMPNNRGVRSASRAVVMPSWQPNSTNHREGSATVAATRRYSRVRLQSNRRIKKSQAGTPVAIFHSLSAHYVVRTLQKCTAKHERATLPAAAFAS